MNYDEAVRYLMTLGRELASPQQARAAKFDLANTRKLCERMGEPQRAYASAHIAGTNGKGSTAAFLESILRSAGLRTGLYTSPHLERINERICVNGEPISDGEFAVVFTRLQRIIEELLAAGELAAHPTFFECVTALAFDHFARAGVQIGVFEVGMGGRLDSTNVLVPNATIITQIDFDHESYLGHSIEEIAGEKAGIIKPGVRVISAAENPSAAAIIRSRAAEQAASLSEIDNLFRLEDVCSREGCYSFTAVRTDSGAPLRLSLPLPGRFQVRNALAALAAAQSLAEQGMAIPESAMISGMIDASWPGRLERVAENPAVYLDGMHNPGAARNVAEFWDAHLSGRNIYLIYGAMRDKAVDEVAGLLFPRATAVILTAPPQPRSISPATLAAMTSHYARRAEVVSAPEQALERAWELASPDDVIFVAGSLFLVGCLRGYAKSRSRAPRSLGDYAAKKILAH